MHSTTTKLHMRCGVGVVDKLDIVAIGIERLLDRNFVALVVAQLNGYNTFTLLCGGIRFGCNHETAVAGLALILRHREPIGIDRNAPR